jgi:hypothetical protein
MVATNVPNRESQQPLIQKNADSGWLAWLRRWLPAGIRFQGPAIGDNNEPEVLATADCVESSAQPYCNGLGNLEEYVAAVHASRNLHIPFEMLKERIAKGETLEEAIRELRPGSDYKKEAAKAMHEAIRTVGAVSSS